MSTKLHTKSYSNNDRLFFSAGSQFEIRKVAPGTAIARRAFDEAFFHWNPNLSREFTYSSYPYYEYLEEV